MSKKNKVKKIHGKNNELGTRISIFSLIVAIIAIFFTYQQNSLTREHNRLSVIPHVNSYFSDNKDKGLFGVYAVNNGLGMAIIKDLRVFIDGKEIIGKTEDKFLLAINKLGLNDKCFYIMTPRDGDSMAVNEELEFIKIKNREPECFLAYADLSHRGSRFNYIIYFESLYGEKFKYTYLENKQVRL